MPDEDPDGEVESEREVGNDVVGNEDERGDDDEGIGTINELDEDDGNGIDDDIIVVGIAVVGEGAEDAEDVIGRGGVVSGIAGDDGITGAVVGGGIAVSVVGAGGTAVSVAGAGGTAVSVAGAGGTAVPVRGVGGVDGDGGRGRGVSIVAGDNEDAGEVKPP